MLTALLCLLIQDPKLNYPQDSALKSAEKSLNSFDKDIQRLRDALAKLKDNKDTAVVARAADNNMNAIGNLNKNLDNVVADLKKNAVPENHSRYAAVKDRIDKDREALDGLKKEYEGLKGGAAKAADTGSYPDYDHDVKELDRISEFCKLENFDRDAAMFKKLKEVYPELEATIKWVDERRNFYQPYFTSGTAEAKNIKAKFDQTAKDLFNFNMRVQSFVKNMQGGYKDNLGKANKLLEVARNEKKFHYFKEGGQGLTYANEARGYLMLLAALWGMEHETIKAMKADWETFIKGLNELGDLCKEDAIADASEKVMKFCGEADKLCARGTSDKNMLCFDGARKQLEFAKAELDKMLKRMPDHAKTKESKDKYDAVAKALDEQSAAVKTELVNKCRAPENAYKGSEMADLKKLVVEAYKKAFEKEEVLEVRFPVEQWKREDHWDWDKGMSRWVHVDTSYLQVRVVVKASDKTAFLYVATMEKDHLSNDALKARVFDRKQYAVEEMLLENLK
jgi:hypothetical protein